MRRFLPLLLLAACHAPSEHEAAKPAAARPEVTASLAYTESFEIRFGDELCGFLVEVQPVPAGETDARPYTPGTAVIQDKDLRTLGFISPHGTTYRFNAEGEAKPVGWGSRNQSIAAFFRRNGSPRILAVATGQPQG